MGDVAGSAEEFGEVVLGDFVGEIGDVDAGAAERMAGGVFGDCGGFFLALGIGFCSDGGIGLFAWGSLWIG